MNGAASYVYDNVGNRKQITSTLAPIPAGLFNYDANDRFTAGDTYDNDGNTVSSGGIANTYDFENHLIQNGGVTIVYDGDGNRVSKTVAGVTTTYLVDTLNPTGYAQVVSETFSGSSAPNRELSHIYVYGLELIGQTRNYVANSQSNTQQIYYDYDGHGSVRGLTDPNGVVTDTYDYDAFGNLIHSSTTLASPTPNNYLFAGEQFDSDLNLYYNRARYLNVSTGRFWNMDSFEGQVSDPSSLHKYLYCGASPVGCADPTGHDFDLISTVGALAAQYPLVTSTLLGAGIGGALGCVGGALDSQSTCSQGFYSGILAGAVTGALSGVYLGTAFGASQVGRVYLSLAVSGVGGSAAYYAAKRKEYTLAIFYAFTTLGSAWLIAGSSGGSAASGSPSTPSAGGPLPPQFGWLPRINPSGNMTNCVNCALAVDDALAGLGVRAADPTSGPVPINQISSQWLQYGTAAEIEQAIAGAGPGARGIVFGGYRGGTPPPPGHVFNVVNFEGQVYFLDGQSGGAAQTGGFDFFYFVRTQ